MREFFVDNHVGIPFYMFSWIHFLLIILTSIIVYIIYKFRNDIRNIKMKKKIRYVIALIMFLNMTIYYGAYVYYGVYNWKVHLPLHLCFISGYLFMYALVCNNIKLRKLAYFMAFIGPLPAIIWSDLNSVDSFVFIQFIISHHFFLCVNLFVYYMDNLSINISDVKKVFVFVNTIFIVMLIFNVIMNTNYIMTKSFPETFLELYPFFRGITPIPFLEIAGIIVAFIAYIPVYYRNKENNN